MDQLKEKLINIIKELYGEALGASEQEGIGIDFAITAAPKNMEADYSTNVAMLLAKTLHKNPMEIATEIVKRYDEDEENKFPVEIAAPGFLNFISPDEYFIEKITDFGKNFTKNITCDEYKDQTVICEFSDPNPFKVLHVGHLYTSMVGDSISKLVEFAGGKVIRANFGGDVGLHVAKTLFALKGEGVNPADLTIEKIAECYVKGTQAYEDDESAHNEITAINSMVYSFAAEGEGVEDEDEEKNLLRKYYWTGRALSYQYFEDFYNRIGVKFDIYYPESKVADRGLEVVRDGLAKGVYEESDGAVVFKGENYGLHTRVFINKNGLPTYESKDIGLLFTKNDDYHFDKSIVITGNDIIEYMKVVLKSVEQYAPELVEKTIHLTHGNVRLPGNEKMSSRKGNFIKAVDVLNSVNEALAENYEGIDPKVALGATKYAFLKYKIGGNIEFDVKSSVSMTGNSGPYLQYSAVRAKKIIANTMKNGISASSDAEWKLEEHERDLMKKIIEYAEVLNGAVKELSPNKICAYLYELAQEFSRFYENVKVAGSKFEFERGQIVLAYLKVMMHGLGLLGIEVPEKM